MKKLNGRMFYWHITSIFALVLLIGTIVSCDEDETSSTVRGTVLGRVSQIPLDSAWVNTIEDTDGARYAGTDGRFSITTFGKIEKIYAGKTGFQTKLVELPSGEAARQNIIVELDSLQTTQ